MKISPHRNPQTGSSLYGIIADNENDIDPASLSALVAEGQNLKTVGVIFTLAEDNSPEEIFLDVVITWRLSNLNVLVEVPYSAFEKGLDPAYLRDIIFNMKVDVALLPPTHPDDKGDTKDLTRLSQYNQLCANFAKLMLERQQFEQFVFPISSFMEYVMLEQLVSSKELLARFKPVHPYLIENFVSFMTEEQSDALKLDLRKAFYEAHYGQENFEMVARGLMVQSLEKVKSFAQNIGAQGVNNEVLPMK